ncbi:MAG TPA: hypothetical protein EYP90_05750 [Chromatiaceae bacterium]|nr:hypothetical protein [Chromatiaceae bacterium]
MPRLLSREVPTGRIDPASLRPQTKLLTNRAALERFYEAVDAAKVRLEGLQYEPLSEQELRQRIDEIFGSLPDWRQVEEAKRIDQYLRETIR